MLAKTPRDMDSPSPGRSTLIRRHGDSGCRRAASRRRRARRPNARGSDREPHRRPGSRPARTVASVSGFTVVKALTIATRVPLPSCSVSPMRPCVSGSGRGLAAVSVLTHAAGSSTSAAEDPRPNTIRNHAARSFQVDPDPVKDQEIEERGRLRRPSGAPEEQHPALTWRLESACSEGGCKPTALATLLKQLVEADGGQRIGGFH